jgi:hypothetical protein
MAIDRLVVRPRYGSPEKPDQWQVVDPEPVEGVRVLGTFNTRQDAARHVLKLGARVACDWSRMEIGGHTSPYDYAAHHFRLVVGRVYRSQGTSHEGAGWLWFMYAHLAGRMGNARGRCDDKTEAAAEVEREFTMLLAR